jgi:hypothetical protein
MIDKLYRTSLGMRGGGGVLGIRQDSDSDRNKKQARKEGASSSRLTRRLTLPRNLSSFFKGTLTNALVLLCTCIDIGS